MRRILAVSLGVLVLVGCSTKAPKGTVKGTITYKSQPINGGALLLYPTGQGQEVTIPLSQEGTFSVADVPVGDYKVVVQPAPTTGVPPASKDMTPEMKARLEALKGPPPTIPFPDKYKDKQKTDLTCTVTKGGQTLTLEMKD
jgi:hypothetical protein